MDYFQDYTKYFWRWEDDGEVIVIDRMTVIYQKQLQELLISISEIGLPKFGSLLLVIAATNIRSIEQYDNICEALDRCHTGNFEDNIKQAKEFIEKIYLIDQKHKRGIRKIHLLLAVFENSHNRKSIKSSQTIASVFRKTGLSKEHTIKFSIDNKTLLDRELRILQLLNKKFPTTDSIEQKILELPEIEDIDLEIQDRKNLE